MKFSVADQLALIYTSAGSQRKLARVTGLSRYMVGKLLKANIEGGDISRQQSDPEIKRRVAEAFEAHKDLARAVARRHEIPFSSDIPVYMERLPLKSQGVYVDGVQVFRGSPEEARRYAAGKLVTRKNEDGEVVAAYRLDPDKVPRAEVKRLLGARAIAQHMHWLPDRIKRAYIQQQVKTRRFAMGSMGSQVDFKKYNRQAEERQKIADRQGLRRQEPAIIARQQIKQQIRDGVEIQRVFTPLNTMQGNAELIAESMLQVVEIRHAGATGAPGTQFADQLLLQVDQGYKPDAKRTKSRGTAKRRK